MNSKKELQKISYKFKKDVKKYMNNVKTRTFMVETGYKSIVDYGNDKGKYLSVVSDLYLKKCKRKNIVKTLQDINYRRETNKWNESTGIGFITEVMECYKNEMSSFEVYSKEFVEDYKKEISERYNVPENKLKVQLGLILTNYKNGVDPYNIYRYFEPYEIVMWKYRNIKNLNEALENGKITEEELNLIKDIYEV